MILTDHDKSWPTRLSLNYKEPYTHQKIGQFLFNWLPKNNTEIIFICVGSDRSTGDALGPITGSILSKRKRSKFKVFGTLESPIHALNLTKELAKIKKKHPESFIIGVDACLGKVKSIGNINAAVGPLKPGLAMKKQLPEVGQFHLTGIVNSSSSIDFLTIQNTRLQIVIKQAEIISRAISYAEYLLTDKIKSFN